MRPLPHKTVIATHYSDLGQEAQSVIRKRIKLRERITSGQQSRVIMLTDQDDLV